MALGQPARKARWVMAPTISVSVVVQLDCASDLWHQRSPQRSQEKSAEGPLGARHFYLRRDSGGFNNLCGRRSPGPRLSRRNAPTCEARCGPNTAFERCTTVTTPVTTKKAADHRW
jgi:hypothetical protein